MWIRRVQIIVTNAKDPSKQVVYDNHSIEFQVRSTIGWGADTATVTIYNLALEEIRALQNRTLGEMLIEIRAGYEDNLVSGGVNVVTAAQGEQIKRDSNGNAIIDIRDGNVLPTIFSGVIANCIGYKNPPEQIAQIFCISKAAVKSSVFVQMKSLPANITLGQAIKSMCSDYGFDVVSTYGVTQAQLDIVLPNGRVFHDTFVKEFTQLLEEFHLKYFMATSDIQIFSDTYGDADAVTRMSKGRDPIKIDANTVIGTPIAGIGVFDLEVYLTNIQPGMVIDVSPLLGTELLANGVVGVSDSGNPQLLNYDNSVFKYALNSQYLVESVITTGETHGMNFQCSIRAVLPGNTASAENDKHWKSLYDTSGMSQHSWGFDG